MKPKKNSPLIPDSLAADGMQGAGAKAVGPHDQHDKARRVTARDLARIAIARAQAQLDLFAKSTDEPPDFIVEVADCLDDADRHLASPEAA